MHHFHGRKEYLLPILRIPCQLKRGIQWIFGILSELKLIDKIENLPNLFCFFWGGGGLDIKFVISIIII